MKLTNSVWQPDPFVQLIDSHAPHSQLDASQVRWQATAPQDSEQLAPSEQV